MAKKFFKNKVYNRKKNIINIVIISLSVIGVIICFIITSTLTNRAPENAVIELHKSLDIEINSELPKQDLYFEELKNVEEDKIEINTKDIDITKLGKYTAELKIYNEKHDVTINVIDTTIPNLTVKDISIEIDEKYSANDFLDKCSDNSKEECNITFYSDGINENGEKLDYSGYTNPGTYEIKISAKDSSGNQTIESAKLTINGDVTTPVCSFGDLNYDTTYTLAYIVGNNNCAIDLNLYQNEEIRKPVVDIATTDTNKLKTQINAIKGLANNITINRTIDAILNTAGSGVVGYTLFIEVKDGNGQVIVSYNIDLNGNRVYKENPHNIN